MIYQIYFKGRVASGPETLERYGLSGLIKYGGHIWADTMKGPEGNGIGKIMSFNNSKADVPMAYSDTWDWTPYVGESGDIDFYIGVNPKDTPGHDDLIVDGHTPGKPVTFANGKAYVVPVAESLPSRHRLVGGKWIRAVSSKYEEFYLLAQEIWGSIVAGLDEANILDMPDDVRPKTMPVTVDIANNFVCEALSINYKLCPEVIDALGIIDDESVASTVIAVLEIEDIISSVNCKKKEGSIGIPVT